MKNVEAGSDRQCPSFVSGLKIPYLCAVGDELFKEYLCATCGQPNETLVDLSAGTKQVFTEDCAACCRPNVLRLSVNAETLEVSLEVEFEG